jgi:hypothetical protein
MAGKKFEMTGSPKPFFEKKEVFVQKMSEFGWSPCKMKKRDNECEVLISDSLTKTSNKTILANELGIQIMSYEEIVDLFGLETDGE